MSILIKGQKVFNQSGEFSKMGNRDYNVNSVIIVNVYCPLGCLPLIIFHNGVRW